MGQLRSLWPQSPHLPNGQVTQCCEKPSRSVKVNLWVPSVDPGTVRVSALAGEGGGSWGEGGLSSTMSGWLSASAYSTCTSGCSFVAGTWGEEGEASQREREARSRGPWCSSRKHRKDVWSSLWQPHLPMGPTGELHAGGARMQSPVASEDHGTPATSPGTTKEAMMP